MDTGTFLHPSFFYFSSPGCLVCKEGGLGVQERRRGDCLLIQGIYDHSLFPPLPLSFFPSSLPTSRIPQIFARENSGTYNCEWMVVDATQHSFHVLDQVGEKGRKGRKGRRKGRRKRSKEGCNFEW